MSPASIEATCTAPVNIAVIKYWGKRDVELNLPCNSSLSVTLSQDHLQSKTTVRASAAFTADRLWLNGVEEDITNPRLQVCLKSIRERAEAQAKRNGVRPAVLDWKVHICSFNNFPTAAGLASSASGYACLVVTLARVFGLQDSMEDLSTIARQGSGSACRSLFGGFVAWNMGEAHDGWDSRAEQIADEHFWNDLECLVLVVSAKKKAVSSTAGMQTSMATSPLLQHRAASIVPDRMKQMKKAILERDFGAFARLTIQDSNQFHAVCLDTYPPIFYMNDISKTIVLLLSRYNDIIGGKNNPIVAYTFDAGPNAVLYVQRQHVTCLLSVLLHYFPPSTDTTPSDYFADPYGIFHNNPADFQETEKTLLNAIPLEPQQGVLRYILHSRVGDGPRVLTSSESLLSDDGLPKKRVYQQVDNED